MPHSPAHRAPWPLTLLRALFALATLAILVAGVPLLLLAVGHLPGHLPTWDEATGLLGRPDDGSLLTTTITLAAWVAWLWLTIPVLLETGAVLIRRSTPRLPGMATGQRLAVFLLGSLLLASPAAVASAATPAVAVTATHTPHTLDPHPTAPTGPSTAPVADRSAAADRAVVPAPSGPSTGTAAERPEVHVGAGGASWYDLAQQYLGNGLAYAQLQHENPHLPASDYLPAHSTVYLPHGTAAPAATTAIGAAPAPAGEVADVQTQLAAAPAPADREYTVKNDDSLSLIAQHELGTADRWQEIYEQNKGEPQPNGHPFDDPDLIFPGQKLDLPPSGTAHPKPPAAASPHDKTSNPRATGQPPTPPASTSTPTPAAPASQNPAAQQPGHTTPVPSARPASPAPPSSQNPTAAATPPAPSASPTDPAPDNAGSTGTAIGVRTVGGIGLLLAAGLLTSLSVKRVLQRRRRAPGENIAMPDPETGTLEEVLGATQEPASVDLLDRALRTLAHTAAQDGNDLPALRGAKVTHRSIHLLPEDPSLAPCGPFTRTETSSWWTLTSPDELLPADQAAQTPAPYPGLVTLGADSDESHLLLNLPHARTLLLDGTDEDVLAVARAIALEAANSSWSDRADILTVGLGSDIAALLPSGRLRPIPHLRAALSDLGEVLLEAHQNQQSDNPPVLPWLLICAADATEDDAWQLADAVARAEHLPVALVLPARAAAASFPDAERLDASATGLQPCHLLESDLTLQSISAMQYAEFVGLLHTTEEPARPAEGAWENVPAPAVPSPVPAHPDRSHPAGPGTAFPALTAAAGQTSPASVPLLHAVSTPPERSNTPPPDAPDSASPAQEPSDDGVEGTVDLHAPEIQVLGKVAVTGVQASGHGHRLALLAALIYFQPGRSAEDLCEAMDPRKPWSKATLQARISELRNRLGHDPDGKLYLPRDRSGGYRFSGKVRCDWDRFTQLAERGLAKGSPSGLADLEAALALVRGRPFGGADHIWAAARIQEMTTKVTDVAHTVATWQRTAARPDLPAARRAVIAALDVDDSAELLYQDWMLIDDQAGNRPGVLQAIETLQSVNRRLDVSMEPGTERTIEAIMKRGAQAQGL
ncbi:LysM peptidoglycan-binding domain-containing protein [Streptomyces sp. NPDC001205]